MIGKEDILRYIGETAELEQGMVETYRYMADNVHDASVKRRLEALLREELQHAQTIEQLRRRIAEQ